MNHARLSLWCFRGLTALLVALCGLFLWHTLAVLSLRLPLDPNEGWNAYHSLSAWGGLYPPKDAYLVNNYPPLSFYVIALIKPIFGDAIVAGRMVSLVSMAVVVTCLYGCARRMGATRAAAAFGGLFLFGGLLIFTDYVGMDDPQLFAHALSLTGFGVLLRWRTRPALIAAAVLFVLAFFVKHNVVVLAAVCALWLLLTDRRRFWPFAIAGLALLLGGLVLFYGLYDVPLWQVLASARSYSWDLLWAGACSWLRWSLVPLIGLGALWFHRHDPWLTLTSLYAVAAILLGLYFIGGAGVDANALFEADIALSFVVALTLTRLSYRPVWASLLLVPFVLGSVQHVRDYGPVDFFVPARSVAVAQSDIAFLQSHPGAGMCAMLSLCYWAGKAPEVDFFNTGEAFATQNRDDSDLVHRLERADFAVIQFDPDSDDALGPNVQAAVARFYRLDHRDDFGSFYLPR
ncbi:MAG: glycosyltransferase family 39 protein [Rhizomicrobium sp.]